MAGFIGIDETVRRAVECTGCGHSGEEAAFLSTNPHHHRQIMLTRPVWKGWERASACAHEPHQHAPSAQIHLYTYTSIHLYSYPSVLNCTSQPFGVSPPPPCPPPHVLRRWDPQRRVARSSQRYMQFFAIKDQADPGTVRRAKDDV